MRRRARERAVAISVALLMLAGCGAGDNGEGDRGAGDSESRDSDSGAGPSEPGTSEPGTSEPETTPTPDDQEKQSASTRALAALLPATAVPPAPPGDALVIAMEPSEVAGVIGEPSRQVMICTPVELSLNDPGSAEPDAAGAATSGFVTGVAQVDQYAVVYTDEAAAERAVGRAQALTEDCQAAFAVHATGADAEAIVSAAPSGVDGFRARATYAYQDTGFRADEISAVLRSGATVLYLRANETGAPAEMDWPTDGILDQDWSDQLVTAAAENLVR